jgi:hypothetical protein
MKPANYFGLAVLAYAGYRALNLKTESVSSVVAGMPVSNTITPPTTTDLLIIVALVIAGIYLVLR